jgi:uncharacterized membrane protein
MNNAMVILSAAALVLVLAWLFHFRAKRTRTVSLVATMDWVNVGFAIVFAALFLSKKSMIQSPFIALLLIAGALMLALGQR